jgi:hypothetical protein
MGVRSFSTCSDAPPWRAPDRIRFLRDADDAWHTDHTVDWSSSDQLKSVHEALFVVHVYPNLLDVRAVLKHLPS